MPKLNWLPSKSIHEKNEEFRSFTAGTAGEEKIRNLEPIRSLKFFKQICDIAELEFVRSFIA